MNPKLHEAKMKKKEKEAKELLKSKTWWKLPKWVDKLPCWKWFTYR